MRTPEATILGSYAYGWQQFRKYFLYVFLVGIIVGVATALGGGFGWPPVGVSVDGDGAGAVVQVTASMVILQILFAAYRILVLPVINFGANGLYLKYIRNEQADIGEIFDGFRTNYLNIVLASLLMLVIIGLGFVMLIVPGIIFACRLAFVPYLVVDKRLDPVAAVEKSWNMTRGYGWRVFGMYLLAIPVTIIGFLCLIVGMFFAVIWVSCAFAALYHAIDLEDQAALNENGALADAGEMPSGDAPA
jgi:uncharacterized membrane protein